MKWENLTKEDIEYVKVIKSGHYCDFTCTRRNHCDVSDDRDATHCVMFEKKNSTQSKHLPRPYFYSCKECIRDVYWKLNETDIKK